MFTIQIILCWSWFVQHDYRADELHRSPLSISYPRKSEFHSRVGSTCDEYKIDLRWGLSISDNQDNNDTDVDFADGADVE